MKRITLPVLIAACSLSALLLSACYKDRTGDVSSEVTTSASSNQPGITVSDADPEQTADVKTTAANVRNTASLTPGNSSYPSVNQGTHKTTEVTGKTGGNNAASVPVKTKPANSSANTSAQAGVTSTRTTYTESNRDIAIVTGNEFTPIG